MDTSRAKLEEYLLSICPAETDAFLSVIFKTYRHLRREYEQNGDGKAILKNFINLFVSNKLKFTAAEEIINKIDIILDFYDISDELLFNNDDFIQTIEKYNLDFRQTSIGYERL